MSGKTKAIVLGIVIVVGAGAFVVARRIHRRKRVLAIAGAVIRQDSDPRKEIPIAHAVISAAKDLAASEVTSDSNGYFFLPLRSGITPGQAITLRFRHPDYKPLDLEEIAGQRIYLARMLPLEPASSGRNPRTQVTVGNIDVRYSIKTSSIENVGTVVKTFQVVHSGSTRCAALRPCSPDGRWQAASGELSLDAGEGNEFHGVRVSCIAGPCPFTHANAPVYSQEGRTVRVTAIGWSDTATFLVEGEVDKVVVSSTSVESFPITFGEALSFAVPDGAEGVAIEAEMNGKSIVFPLGPDLILTWANCSSSSNSDKARAYRCVLKPGYRFQ